MFEISQRQNVLQVLMGVIAIDNVCRMKREVQIANALSKRQHERREDIVHIDGVDLLRLANTPVIV